MDFVSLLVGIVFVAVSIVAAGDIGYRFHRSRKLKNMWKARRIFDGARYLGEVEMPYRGIVRDHAESGPVQVAMAFLDKGILLVYTSPFPTPISHRFALFFPWQAVKAYKPVKLPPIFYVSNFLKKGDTYYELYLRKTEMTLILPEKYLNEIKSRLPMMQLEFV